MQAGECMTCNLIMLKIIFAYIKWVATTLNSVADLKLKSTILHAVVHQFHSERGCICMPCTLTGLSGL